MEQVFDGQFPKFGIAHQFSKDLLVAPGADWEGTPFEANPISLTAFQCKRTKEGLMIYFRARFDSKPGQIGLRATGRGGAKTLKYSTAGLRLSKERS